jgi:hypothetical protein
MWPIGSAPDVDGAPPLWRIQRTSATGSYPATGPAMTPRLWGPPRVSDHSWQGPTGTPSTSTGTVLAHCPVQETATTVDGSTTPDARARRAESRTRSHHRAASWVAPPSGPRSVGTARCSCQRHQPDLRASGVEVDGQRPGLLASSGGRLGHHGAINGSPPGPPPGDRPQASPGMACWASIMSAITIRMNSSASSVRPPATPP